MPTPATAHATISIKIGSKVRVDYNPTFQRWYISDDGLIWYALPANIKSADSAIKRAATYFGIVADNLK
jgi:hypothetical protein